MPSPLARRRNRAECLGFADHVADEGGAGAEHEDRFIHAGGGGRLIDQSVADALLIARVSVEFFEGVFQRWVYSVGCFKFLQRFVEIAFEGHDSEHRFHRMDALAYGVGVVVGIDLFGAFSEMLAYSGIFVPFGSLEGLADCFSFFRCRGGHDGWPFLTNDRVGE